MLQLAPRLVRLAPPPTADSNTMRHLCRVYPARQEVLPVCVQVLQLPSDAVRLASSPTADNDMWGAGAGRVLAIQGHPEMSCPTAAEKILPAVSRCGACHLQCYGF